MKLDLKHLRELCDAATQGEWTCEDVICPDGDQTYRIFADREPLPTSGWKEDETPNLLLADTHYYPLVPHKNDARFIAATDPQTVRSMIDEIEWLMEIFTNLKARKEMLTTQPFGDEELANLGAYCYDIINRIDKH